MSLYIKSSGFLYSLDTRVKWVAVVVIACIVLSIPIFTWAIYILLFSILFSLAIATQLPVKKVFHRTFLIEVPILLVLLPLPFVEKTPPYFFISWADWYIRISQPELLRILALMLRSWLVIFTMVLFTMTTTADKIFSSLIAFKVPAILINIIQLMWRYLALFSELARSMSAARVLRSVPSEKHLRNRFSRVGYNIKYTGSMIGSMLVRAFERSERIYQAMILRGFDGNIRTIQYPTMQATQFMQIGFLLIFGLCFIIGAYGINR